MSLSTEENVEGPPSSASPTGCASKVTAVTTAAMPSTQPTMKATLAAFARGASSIRITAMIGTGEIATPRATGRKSPMTVPMSAPRPRRRETTTHTHGGADATLGPAARTYLTGFGRGTRELAPTSLGRGSPSTESVGR